MNVNAPTGKSKEDLETLLFDRVARCNRTDGGKHVKSGWHATKRPVNRSSMTSRSC